MLISGLLASAEHGINRVLQMDSTALPRLDRLSGKVIAVQCTSPAFHLHILPSDEGLMLAANWEGGADVTLRAPAASLMRLALSKDKNAVLHSPEVELDGESAVLLELVGVLQDLDLDWEYELQRWLGPVATPLIGGHLRNSARWTTDSIASLSHNLAEYLAEESRTLVGKREAEARFAELDQTKQDLERLEARFERLAQSLKSSDNA
ncbi:MAG: SCP2 sterol-binding domain-containing protein [Pseudomonas sp.]|jgi:ubiquinone biosynthesis protein UbiJ|uniref:ubiquinone biosynthesis accessory factor UbiJ n=1 Tax=Pseudomonas sp. TaxID=306 RepID=UPI0023A50624|nr:SCP2 sterol-binding domain-containing protein [Pseudomonas sp.]MDE1197907.1 SCP2 sterol-binding domain-containing protein [Pseudomonas sp.]